MAIVNATITFALPEDLDSDVLELLASSTKNGTYVISEQAEYQYGTTKYEPVALDDAYWYKIRFRNASAGSEGPLSDPVWGGTYTSSAPFLAVSSTTDGANYATAQDVYDYAQQLTSEDVSVSLVSSALRRARASIDFRTAEMGIERFDTYDTDTARRKYNASLRILKEAEINIALGHLYQSLSDDRIMENSRSSAGSTPGQISIGDTSIGGDDIADRAESILFLATLSTRYFATGEELLSSLDTNSVKLSSYDLGLRNPRFRYPFNGY